MSGKKFILGLRTCSADMTSYDGFELATSGTVTCPDWNPEPVCGGGLHFLPWGEGNETLLDWSNDAVWLVVKAKAHEVVVIDDEKAKAPSVEVVFCGNQKTATDYLSRHGAAGKTIVGGTATAGYRGTATAGDGGTATAGHEGTATAGYRGTATAGDGGTATAGDRGTATAGYRGTATAGDRGTATAGYRGTLIIKWWDEHRYRISVAYIGENGILKDTAYVLNDKGEFVQK